MGQEGGVPDRKSRYQGRAGLQSFRTGLRLIRRALLYMYIIYMI